MPSARQPSAALADRAERHVFDALPALAAVERRALALAELTDLPRAAALRDTGLEEAEYARALARARKALRRTRAPLAGGGRCERAEHLASDRLDAPLPREQRKWLEIHVARCPRCTEHLALLDEARTELRVTFLAEPPRLPPAPEPPATEPVAQLRVVPEPEPEPLGGLASPTGTEAGPTVAEPPRAPAPPTPAPPMAPAPVATHPRRELSPAVKSAARTIAIFLAIAAIVAAAVAGLSTLGDDSPRSAPWDAPSAPDVRPAPLVDQ